MSGLRTERVTLEITQQVTQGYTPVCSWPWDEILEDWGLDRRGEYARVVEDGDTVSDEAVAHGATLNALAEARESLAAANRGIARLTAERDAAIRDLAAANSQIEGLERASLVDHETIGRLTAERDAARDKCDELEDRQSAMTTAERNLLKQRDELRARVAELEQQINLDDRWGSVAPAANAGGEQSQPPSGWLTAEERAAVEEAMVDYGSNVGDNDCERIERVLRALLARETPPRVKVPPKLHWSIGEPEPNWTVVHEVNRVIDKCVAAIREAGGEVQDG